MKRRKFIGYSTVALAGAGAGYYLWSEWPVPQRIEYPQFLMQILSRSEVVEIGKAYVRRFPMEASEQALHEILGAGPDGEITGKGNLNALIQADYADENTLVLVGWVVSRTEARQCALFAITKG